MKEIKFIIKKKEVLEKALERIKKKKEIKNITKKEFIAELKEVLREELQKMIKLAPAYSKILLEVEKGTIFDDQEVRKRIIEDLNYFFEEEKRRWLKTTCSLKDFFLEKTLKKKLFFLLAIPFDFYFFSHYFNLLKKFSRNIILACDINLKERISFLEKLKEDIQELRWLDYHFSRYCQLPSSYYQTLVEVLNEKILFYQGKEEIDRIIWEIKEII